MWLHAPCASALASSIARVCDVLFWSPGLGARADFSEGIGPRGPELAVRTEFQARGQRYQSTNRLDLRFRVWLPACMFLALTAATPIRLAARCRMGLVGMTMLLGNTLVAAWMVAVEDLVIGEGNLMGIGLGWRVLFSGAYHVLVLSRPTAAAIPLALWAILSMGFEGWRPFAAGDQGPNGSNGSRGEGNPLVRRLRVQGPA